MSVPAIKNIVFDLGGVILDLSVPHTLHAFASLSGIDPEDVRKIFVSSSGFIDYETGALDDHGFREFVREVYAVNVSDEAIDQCWNAMLLDVPPARLMLLDRLKERYNVYLLSNTNGIHLNYINGVLMPRTGQRSLDSYFHNAYYSHRMGKRKPDAAIFEQVLDENSLRPEETLFLDDNFENVEGARSLGIQTAHVNKPDFILEYFNA